MSTFLSVLLFIAVGALVGFLGTYLFKGMSMLISLLLGIVGSLAVSWIAKLLGLGAGFLSFSWWGLILGIVGAFLFVAIYGFFAQRAEQRETSRV